MNKWQIVFDKNCKAVEKINRIVSQYVDYPVPCNLTESQNNRIILKTDSSMEGYSIFAKDNEIVITAKDDVNLLYAASDFNNKFIPYWKNPNAKQSHYNVPFIDDMPEFSIYTSPKIKKRGIWTWGHVIYDYKKFIDNMVVLRLNTLIIWNDFVPINICEVIDYAHENGIYIYLGFAWGWDQKCAEQIKELDSLPQNISDKYKEEYSHLHCDGIYFQTFTELTVEEVNGVTIADAAVSLVNKTAELIYKQKPDLEILFGLHATSVHTKLDIIAKTDKRITVMWEDLGAFPYAYSPSVTDGFDKTLKLQQDIQKKFDKFAAVLKGVCCLDWHTFEHQIINEFSENDIITVLCEDCLFEQFINFPMAVYSQMLWNPDRDTDDILCEAALMSEVDFI